VRAGSPKSITKQRKKNAQKVEAEDLALLENCRPSTMKMMSILECVQRSQMSISLIFSKTWATKATLNLSKTSLMTKLPSTAANFQAAAEAAADQTTTIRERTKSMNVGIPTKSGSEPTTPTLPMNIALVATKKESQRRM
jgi:hypothetical protein